MSALQSLLKTLKNLIIFLSMVFLLSIADSLIYSILAYVIRLGTGFSSDMIEFVAYLASYLLFTIISARLVFDKYFEEKKFSVILQMFTAFSIYTAIPLFYYILNTTEMLEKTKVLSNTVEFIFNPMSFCVRYANNPYIILVPFVINCIIYYCTYNMIFYKIYIKIFPKNKDKKKLSIEQRLLFMNLAIPLLILNSHIPVFDDIICSIGYIFLIFSISGNSYIIVNYDDDVKFASNLNLIIRKILLFFTTALCVFWVFGMCMILLNGIQDNYIIGRDMFVPILNAVMVYLTLTDIYKYLIQNYEKKLSKLIKVFRYLYLPYLAVSLLIYNYYFDSRLENILKIIRFNSVVNVILALLIGFVIFKVRNKSKLFPTVRRA